MTRSEASSQKCFLKYFLLLLCLALGMRVLLAIFYPGSLRPDEIFQYLEPAHHWVFGSWIKTWEWRAGIRSWLVPSFIAGIFRLAVFMHVRDLVLAVRVVFACFSLLPVALFCWAGWQYDRGRGMLLFGLVAALWPDMVNAGIRSLGECFGGNLLASGVILAFIALRQGENMRAGARTFLLGGAAFLLGEAAAVRFQFAPAVAVATLYLLVKGNTQQRFIICIACGVPVLALGVMDKVFLGTWYQSVFKNYYMNIHMGVANTYGKKSFLYFIKKYAIQWGALTPIVAAFCVQSWRYCRFPLYVGLVIFVYHSFVGHKEVSFIYPIVPLFLFCASFGLDDFVCKMNIRMIWVAPCLAASLWLFTQSSYVPYWREKSEIARLQQKAIKQKDLCGLAFFASNQEWPLWPNTLGYSGILGYSGMSRSTAFYLAESYDDLAPLVGRYNYIIAHKGFDEVMPDVMQVKCADMTHLCLYKKMISCDGGGDYDQFSHIVEKTGH